MKILHMSDLHLGKRLCEFSLLEEQRDILTKILGIVDDEKPDCVIIAGDVYNRSVPPEESVQLFDDFLCGLSERKVQTFVISGNHDSAERIAFGGRIMNNGGVHMSPVYSGKTEPFALADEYGPVNVYMLPFIKPINVRRYFPDAEISSYNDALKIAVKEMNINTDERNVLVTHQFITGASLSESEEIFIGGTENIDAAVFKDFDYTALGHIHKPQNISKKMRYCGTPLKYSLSEVNQEKSVTIAELSEKGRLEIREIPLVPLRDVKEYKGTFEMLTDKKFYGKINTDDYIFITLTDENEIPDAVHKLRKIYPHLAKYRYDNSRTLFSTLILPEKINENISPEELFSEFYQKQNNHTMNAEQLEFINRIIKEIWEEDVL